MLSLRQDNGQQFLVFWVPRMTFLEVASVCFCLLKCQRVGSVPEVTGTSLDFQTFVELASTPAQTRNEISSQLSYGPITCARD